MRHGIPILYPEDIDSEHLKEEEHLAQMMTETVSSPRALFSARQWAESKREFWDLVGFNIERPPKSILNIGCGFDSSFVKFQKQGYVFVNFDLVYAMLQALQARYQADFLVAGDIKNLPFAEKQFDYVTCIDVVHHEYDRIRALLTRIKNLLAPGGKLFLQEPNAWGLYQFPKSIVVPKPVFRYLRSTYHRIKKSDHKPADYEFSTNPWEVKTILEDIGFTNVIFRPNLSYPKVTPFFFALYRTMTRIPSFAKYFNYHYTIQADVENQSTNKRRITDH